MNIGPMQAVIAMLTHAAAVADAEPEPVRLMAIALGAECADDTSFAHAGVWIFTFGAYGTHRVVACGHLADALEDAAATLPQGMFVEPDYEEAARELGWAWPVSPDYRAAWDAIHALSTADLTYTESGWLPSYEWTCVEALDALDALDAL